ncbi:RcnB family protein [Phenylobacterium koreense]|uniref:Ni/Co efflux regulator RcnB n=1 Tax=Phenylobacterium koreense TaxID=266125 RepID=A0ABV2EDJ2_9CAUL
MKKAILIAAAAAMTLTGFAASAQPYGGRGGPYGDRDRDGRPNYADRYDNRRPHYGPPGHAYGHRRWARGQRFDHYRTRTYIVNDYRRYGWAPPPRGYAYYRADNGDVVLAALATGIIASVIVGGLR